MPHIENNWGDTFCEAVHSSHGERIVFFARIVNIFFVLFLRDLGALFA